jgi:hypothetical protein
VDIAHLNREAQDLKRRFPRRAEHSEIRLMDVIREPTG